MLHIFLVKFLVNLTYRTLIIHQSIIRYLRL
jgi:hypothetical protein